MRFLPLPSRLPSLLRRRPLVAAAACLLLLAPVSASQAQTDESRLPGKKFAAYEFNWYPIHFVDHFEIKDGPKLTKNWKIHGPGRVGTQNGMFTVYSDNHDATTGATLTSEPHARGRWEIRLRGQRCGPTPPRPGFARCGGPRGTYETEDRDYRVSAELIPAGRRSYDCGARNIALATFAPATFKSRYYARNLPDRQFARTKRFGKLDTGEWHTYGVQVRPRRISWFVDGEVVAHEGRPAALSRVPLDFRLQLEAVDGEAMNNARLQVDTVRYFTLKSPRAKRIPRAPRTAQGTYEGACPAP